MPQTVADAQAYLDRLIAEQVANGTALTDAQWNAFKRAAQALHEAEAQELSQPTTPNQEN